MKNTLYKIRMMLLGVFVSLSVGALAQVGGGSGISAPPASDDPSFATLDVSGNSTLGGTLDLSDVLTITHTFPVLRWIETNAPADEQIWRALVSSGNFAIGTRTDADGPGETAVQIFRTGTTVDRIDLNAPSVDVNGAATLSSTLDVSGAVQFDSVVTHSDVAPSVLWDETDAAADERVWRIITQLGAMNFQTRTDANAVGANFISVARTGTTVDSINLIATDVQINGNDITSETGSFLADTVGCATELTNNTVRYFRIGIHVTVEIDPNGSTCTSDSTAFFLDASVNAPSWWDPLLATGMGVVGGEFINNGSSATGVCASIDASGDIDFSRTCMGNADWTASGSKGFGSENKSFTFLLN